MNEGAEPKARRAPEEKRRKAGSLPSRNVTSKPRRGTEVSPRGVVQSSGSMLDGRNRALRDDSELTHRESCDTDTERR